MKFLILKIFPSLFWSAGLQSRFVAANSLAAFPKKKRAE